MSRLKINRKTEVWDGLGWDCKGVYGGWSDYTEAVAAVEDAKYLPAFAFAFPRMRIMSAYGGSGTVESTVYPHISSTLAQRWLDKVKAANPDLKILYGSTNNVANIASAPQYSAFIPSAYERYITYLEAELRAVKDKIDYFCLGNENLINSSHANAGMIPTSISRSSNVVTAGFSYPHGLTTGDYIFVSGGSDSSFRVADSETVETVQCTVIDANTITYPKAGSDGSGSGSYKINWSGLEVVRKTKAIAPRLRLIAPDMIYVYSESQGHVQGWIAEGITPGVDIDLFGYNGYGTSGAIEATTVGYDSWKVEVDQVWAGFGNTMILTEFNVVLDGAPLQTIEGKNAEMKGFEEGHAREVLRRLNYLRSIGVEQVYYFGSMQGQITYNTYPSMDFGDRYFRGDFRPVFNAIRGERTDRMMLGSGKFDPPGTPYWG